MALNTSNSEPDPTQPPDDASQPPPAPEDPAADVAEPAGNSSQPAGAEAGGAAATPPDSTPAAGAGEAADQLGAEPRDTDRLAEDVNVTAGDAFGDTVEGDRGPALKEREEEVEDGTGNGTQPVNVGAGVMVDGGRFGAAEDGAQCGHGHGISGEVPQTEKRQWEVLSSNAILGSFIRDGHRQDVLPATTKALGSSNVSFRYTASTGSISSPSPHRHATGNRRAQHYPRASRTGP